MNKRSLLALSLAVFVASTFAQVGIHYGVHYEKLTPTNSGSNWHMGLGMDFDLNDRLSGGLDITTDMNWTPIEEAYYIGSSSEYAERLKVIGFQYRSQFHFMDNDRGSVYMGPTIGLRAVRQQIQYTEEQSGAFSGFRTVELEGTGMVFPIGLRVGVRSPLDGGYLDLFLAAGSYLGSGEPFSDLRGLREESLPNRTFFQVGLNYGVGW